MRQQYKLFQPPRSTSSTRRRAFSPLPFGEYNKNDARNHQTCDDDHDGLIRLQRRCLTAAPSFVLSCSAVTSFVWSMLPQTIRGMPSHTIARGTRRTSENVNPGLVLSNKIPALAMAPPFNTSSNALSKKCPCIVLRHFLLI